MIGNKLFWCKKHLATIFLILFFLTEGMSKLAIYNNLGKLETPRIIKFVVILFLLITLLKHLKSLILPSILIVCFLIGQFFLANGFSFEIMTSASKFLFPIVLLIYFHKEKISNEDRKYLFFGFEILLLANCALIFIGYVFDVHALETYRYGRFGFNGLIITSATGSYVYAIGLTYFLLKFKNKFIFNWKPIVTIASCMILGTKAIFLSVGMVLLLYIFCFSNLSRLQKKMFTLAILLILSILGYGIFFYIGDFNQITQEKGFLSSILSFRNDLFTETTLPYINNNWNVGNYFFGGITDLSVRSQLGFLDVFLFWGIIGGIVYLYTFYKSFVVFEMSCTLIFLLLSIVILINLSGNFFENASIAIYCVVFRERIFQSFEDKKP